MGDDGLVIMLLTTLTAAFAAFRTRSHLPRISEGGADIDPRELEHKMSDAHKQVHKQLQITRDGRRSGTVHPRASRLISMLEYALFAPPGLVEEGLAQRLAEQIVDVSLIGGRKRRELMHALASGEAGVVDDSMRATILQAAKRRSRDGIVIAHIMGPTLCDIAFGQDRLYTDRSLFGSGLIDAGLHRADAAASLDEACESLTTHINQYGATHRVQLAPDPNELVFEVPRGTAAVGGLCRAASTHLAPNAAVVARVRLDARASVSIAPRSMEVIFDHDHDDFVDDEGVPGRSTRAWRDMTRAAFRVAEPILVAMLQVNSRPFVTVDIWLTDIPVRDRMPYNWERTVSGADLDAFAPLIRQQANLTAWVSCSSPRDLQRHGQGREGLTTMIDGVGFRMQRH